MKYKIYLAPCPFCGERPELELEEHDDDLNPPRPCWFGRVMCYTCDSTQGWAQLANYTDDEPDRKIIANRVVKPWNTRV
ncbi:MAG: hypothetical protein GY861_26435 [bacterium]|nr:hypothetical protein [bacterium]